jgi:peptidoglycan/LPS O-acetylase OafA/YrhL
MTLEQGNSSTAAPRANPGQRLVAIDVLRGFAILWVVVFHLWGDIKYFPGAPQQYYRQFAGQIGDGAPALDIFTALTDLFFRLGFQGVPLFMMLSGVSLTVAAYRSGGRRGDWPRFFAARFRKLLPPYWFGAALTYGVMAAIAWRQDVIGRGEFAEQFQHGVTISGLSVIDVDWSVVVSSFALLPRLTGLEHFFAPQLALWFVGLLAQYYLLFPLLFLVMRRIGVPAFLLLTGAITLGANAWVVQQYHVPEVKFWLVTGWAPFRLFEFTSGMAIGWLIASPEGGRALAIARSPLSVGAMLALGFVAHTAGGVLTGDPSTGYWQAAALPLATLGLGLLALPLLVKPLSRVDVSLPARAVAGVGVLSYAILIVNDAMRLVASQIRIENPPDAVWWTFLVAIYVPLSIALAWPIALLLGLMPRRAAKPVHVRPQAQLEEPLRELAAISGG